MNGLDKDGLLHSVKIKEKFQLKKKNIIKKKIFRKIKKTRL